MPPGQWEQWYSAGLAPLLAFAHIRFEWDDDEGDWWEDEPDEEDIREIDDLWGHYMDYDGDYVDDEWDFGDGEY